MFLGCIRLMAGQKLFICLLLFTVSFCTKSDQPDLFASEHTNNVVFACVLVSQRWKCGVTLVDSLGRITPGITWNPLIWGNGTVVSSTQRPKKHIHIGFTKIFSNISYKFLKFWIQCSGRLYVGVLVSLLIKHFQFLTLSIPHFKCDLEEGQSIAIKGE